MSRLGWKLFTAYDAYQVVRLWIVSSQFDVLAVSWLQVIIQAVGVVGLAGYAWRRAIGPQWMWKIVAVAQVLYIVSLPVLMMNVDHPPGDWTPVFTLLGRPLAYALVKAYPLVRYGFGERELWRPTG